MSKNDKGSIKTYIFTETPSHGYLRVPKADLAAVGMNKDWEFCPYYDRGNSIEIEEDDDMPEFIRRITEAGWNFKIKHRQGKDDCYTLDCVLIDARDNAFISTRKMQLRELNKLNEEARAVGEIYLAWRPRIWCKFEWVVCSTAIQDHVLMLWDNWSGAYGIVRNPTKPNGQRLFMHRANPIAGVVPIIELKYKTRPRLKKGIRRQQQPMRCIKRI